MSDTRPRKTIKLNYWTSDPDFSANITVLGQPGEVRISANPKTFVNVGQDGVSIMAGPGKAISLQTFSSGVTYAGMLSELPFPINLIPNTMFTAFPSQMLKIPFMNIIGDIATMAKVAGSMI
jgi:hypothetical protein